MTDRFNYTPGEADSPEEHFAAAKYRDWKTKWEKYHCYLTGTKGGIVSSLIEDEESKRSKLEIYKTTTAIIKEYKYSPIFFKAMNNLGDPKYGLPDITEDARMLEVWMADPHKIVRTDIQQCVCMGPYKQRY